MDEPARTPPIADEKELFAAALEFAPGERTAFLRRECVDDALRRRVEALLRAHEGAEGRSFLARRPAPREHVAPDAMSPFAPGERLGSYVLDELLGEGGFGRVYRARQLEPVQRTVAIKVLRPGMDCSQVIARFDAERHALSRMDHAGIATILDAGTAELGGEPYFVMEFVDGETLMAYCDRLRLEVHERLELFVRICLAVHHAHQKGVVHRDLKPSNLLVVERDGIPQPKVIDFGIAKAIKQPLTDHSLQTGLRQVLGTPRYMSPEQAQLGAVDIDARSDIYSLGCVLYELLTGTPPLEVGDGDDELVDLLRRVRDEEATRPSSRVTRTGPSVDELARSRRLDASGLARMLRGDLDWIALKALEKDPTRRYDSAAALARDVERYLTHEPILARRPSSGYLLWKFVRRHQVATTSAAAVVTALVVGFVLAMTGLREANLQRDQTREQLRNTYLAQARASRTGKLAGRRERALGAIEGAAAIRRNAELRDEAIACSTLTDIEPVGTFDTTLEVYDLGPRRVDRVVRPTPDGTIEVVSPSTGVVHGALPTYDKDPWLVIFSPLGEYVAVRYRGGYFVVVDPTRPERTLVSAAAGDFLEDGVAFDRGASPPRWVFVAGSDGVGRVHSLPNGELASKFPVGAGLVTAVSSPDGERIAIAADETPLRVVSSATGDEVLRVDGPDELNVLDWSSDGRWIAGAGTDNAVHVWSAEDGALLHELRGHQAPVVRMAFDPTGRLLASSAWDDTMRLWDVVLGEPFIGPLQGELFITFGDHLVTRRGDTLTCWRVELAPELIRVRTVAPFKSPAKISLHPSGDFYATTGANGLRLWDASSLQQLALLSEEPARNAEFVRGGAAIASGLGDDLFVWPVHHGASGVEVGQRRLLGSFDDVIGVAPGPTEDTVGVIDRAGVHRVDLATGDVVDTRVGYPKIASEPRCSPDGRWMFTGVWQGESGAVWDERTREIVLELPGHHVVGEFSPDGRWLCVGDGSSYRLLEVPTWRVVHEIARDNTDEVAGQIAFSADSATVALARSRYVSCLVDLADGATLASFENPGGIATSDLVLDPTGARLGVVSSTSYLLSWDLRRIRARLDPLGLDWR